jgi:hypothetical protein
MDVCRCGRQARPSGGLPGSSYWRVFLLSSGYWFRCDLDRLPAGFGVPPSWPRAFFSFSRLALLCFRQAYAVHETHAIDGAIATIRGTAAAHQASVVSTGVHGSSMIGSECLVAIMRAGHVERGSEANLGSRRVAGQSHLIEEGTCRH